MFSQGDLRFGDVRVARVLRSRKVLPCIRYRRVGGSNSVLYRRFRGGYRLGVSHPSPSWRKLGAEHPAYDRRYRSFSRPSDCGAVFRSQADSNQRI